MNNKDVVPETANDLTSFEKCPDEVIMKICNLVKKQSNTSANALPRLSKTMLTTMERLALVSSSRLIVQSTADALAIVTKSVWQVGHIIFTPSSDLTNLEELKSCKTLHTLEFVECSSLENLTVLEGFKTLHTLKMFDCTNATNFEGLKGCEMLQTLHINSWGSLHYEVNHRPTNWNGLNECKMLQTLIIEDCCSLMNLAGLEGCNMLRTLYIDSCNSLTNLEGLKGCEMLNTLYINSCHSLRNLARVKDSETLKSLTGLEGCNMLQTMEIDNKSVQFSMYKRLRGWREATRKTGRCKPEEFTRLYW